MIKTLDFDKALQLIDRSTNIFITSHTKPDGDACGCILAAAGALRALSKTVGTLFLSEIPDWYGFLFPQAPFIFNPDNGEQLKTCGFEEADLVILVDVNSTNQLDTFADVLERSKKPILVIDHHLTNDGLGDVQLIDTTAAATGLIVYELFKYAGWPMSSDIAEALFVAIATDTGWFHFNNTDSTALRVCGDLIDLGLDPAAIYHKLYQNFSPQRFRLMSRMLDGLELYDDGKLAVQQITQKDFEATGAVLKDTENLIDECRRIEPVQAAVLFVELEDGSVKCSLRSTGSVDVRVIAQQFGGGGHTMASGINMKMPLAEARKNVIEALRKAI